MSLILKDRLVSTPLFRRTAVAAALVVAAASASALPQFTLDPSKAGLEGTSFTGDNILISDFSTVLFDGMGGFSDSGFLSVSAVQLAGITGSATFTPTGLNTAYGLYFKFSGVGTTTVGDPRLVPTIGSFTSLTYQLYGYNGLASFGFTGNTPTETASNEVLLASGSLVSGNAVTVPTGDGSTFTPSAAAKLNFTVTPGQEAFFVNPNPFYDLAFAAFTNTTTQVEPFAGGFRIRQGGGAINFAATTPVPEPETYALMLAGLAAIGFVALRRRA